MTEDPVLRSKLISEIEAIPNHGKVLIPGCGSRVVLQNQIAESLQNIQEVCCTDFADVVVAAKQHNNHPRIRYEARNSQNLGYEDQWDVVVNVNGILSERDEENRDILDSCFKALKL